PAVGTPARPDLRTDIPPLGTSQNRRGTASIAAPKLAGRHAHGLPVIRDSPPSPRNATAAAPGRSGIRACRPAGSTLGVNPGVMSINDTTSEFDTTNPDVLADLEPGVVPRTTFGLVTEALSRRRKRGLAPFTVMSCDNLQHNGYLARGAFTAFA